MTDEAIDGYLGQDVYPSGFHRQFTPPWIDAMLRHRGIAPPRRAERAPFALLDLGCGDGLGLVALAAAHPEGRFVGVDALPEHVRRATAAAAYAGVGNVAFFCGRFADLDDPVEPVFDYVTAQGVLSWVSPENRAHVRRLCAINLKPGGIACIGYNSMPGWSAGLAVQRMLYLLSEGKPGSAADRFAAALEQVRGMAAAGSPGLDAKFLDWIDGLRGTMSRHYFPHEYLNRDWEPLWSGREHVAMAAHGLMFAGTSRAEMLRTDFVLSEAQQRELAAVAAGGARETALDVMVDQTFRVDLFGRNVAPAADIYSLWPAGWWAATTTGGAADFSLVAQAGTVTFDVPAAHAVLALLAEGPRRLTDLIGVDGVDAAGLRDAIDGLWMSGQILPCDPPITCPAAAVFNRLNIAAARAGAPLPALVGRHGALPLTQGDIVAAGEDDPVVGAALRRLGIDPESSCVG